MADKSLGQHWLFDTHTLRSMCEAARVGPGDTVLEIGPGLGTLSHELLQKGAKVVAVELDKKLAGDLKDRFRGKPFELHTEDILKFDLNKLPKGYKICANIPYYLTSHLLQIITESANRPESASLLVQKEVAERITAGSGEMSILALSVQAYARASLGEIVPASLFSPPPKVDSRILILDFYAKPIIKDSPKFFHVVKAGFSAPRKKLRSSLGAGLHIKAAEADKILLSSNIDPNRRPQTLSIEEWERLAEIIS